MTSNKTTFEELEKSLINLENLNISSDIYRRAFEYINETAKSSNLIITEEIIKKIHFILLGESDYRISDLPERKGYNFPSASDVSHLMHHYTEQMLYSKKMLNDIEFISLCHKRIMDISPFDRGNGTTARLILALLSLNTGYGIIIIPSDFAEEYICTIEKAQNSNNTLIDPFLELMDRIKNYLLNR